jgi:hypothetical protein
VADLVHLAVLAVLATLAAGVVACWIAAALAWRDVTRGNAGAHDQVQMWAVSRSGATDVLVEVADECARQDAKWGEQNHPDGTGQYPEVMDADVAKMSSQDAADGCFLPPGHDGRHRWREIGWREIGRG